MRNTQGLSEGQILTKTQTPGLYILVQTEFLFPRKLDFLNQAFIFATTEQVNIFYDRYDGFCDIFCWFKSEKVKYKDKCLWIYLVQ